MCPSSWKLYVDDFPFFSSSLACLEPELELFEVWEINVRQIIIIANGINSQTPKLQTALARVLDELERNQKKENHLNTTSKSSNMGSRWAREEPNKGKSYKYNF